MEKECFDEKWTESIEQMFFLRQEKVYVELNNDKRYILQELSDGKYNQIIALITKIMNNVNDIIVWNFNLIKEKGYKVKLKRLDIDVKPLSRHQANIEINKLLERYIELFWKMLDIDAVLESYHTNIYDSKLDCVKELCKEFCWNTENVEEKCQKYIHKLCFFLKYLYYAQRVDLSLSEFSQFLNNKLRKPLNYTQSINQIKNSLEILDDDDFAKLIATYGISKLQNYTPSNLQTLRGKNGCYESDQTNQM